MAKKINEYKRDIERALRASGRYNKGLDCQVMSLAGVLRTMDIINADIDNLECSFIAITNRYGNEALAPHPVFKIQKDNQDAVTKQMKALGLTFEDLNGVDDNDPLVDLTKKVRKEGNKKSITIRPDDDV